MQTFSKKNRTEHKQILSQCDEMEWEKTRKTSRETKSLFESENDPGAAGEEDKGNGRAQRP